MTQPASPDLTLSQQLADFAVQVFRNGLPQPIEATVTQHILDTVGLCLAAHELSTSHAVLSFVSTQGGTAQSRVIGRSTALPAPLAAFANGVLAHSLDFDDTHLPSVLHPSASVVPAALAVAEANGASGQELVRAVAAGLEVTVRVGMAGYDSDAGNSIFFEHGQHATSICGALGSAVAAGLLYGLDAAGIADAFGIAASMASGIIEANRTSGTVKRLHCGWAAQAGVTAASLAGAGITGPPTALEGRFGFFEAFLRNQVNPDEVYEGLGTRWTIPDIFIKPYPANHFTHAIVDAAMELRARGVAAPDLVSIRVGAPTAVIRTIGEPMELKRRPKSGYHAQFSGPYAVAAGLLGGGGLGVNTSDYADHLVEDPERQRIMDLVELVPDEQCDKIFPYEFPAVLHAVTTDGTEHHIEMLTTRGGPRRPLSDAEVGAKFSDNACGILSAEQVDHVRDLLISLPEVADVRTVIDLLTPSEAFASASAPSAAPSSS